MRNVLQKHIYLLRVLQDHYSKNEKWRHKAKRMQITDAIQNTGNISNVM
jgi:hypothetical protein